MTACPNLLRGCVEGDAAAEVHRLVLGIRHVRRPCHNRLCGHGGEVGEKGQRLPLAILPFSFVCVRVHCILTLTVSGSHSIACPGLIHDGPSSFQCVCVCVCVSECARVCARPSNHFADVIAWGD